MALKAVLEKLDDVDEAFRGEYKEVEDAKTKKKVFVLDIENVASLPDVDRLNTSLRKERDDHKLTKQKLTPFASLGDPAEVQARLDRIPELEAAAEGKLDDAKINGIVETRLKAKLAPVERERDQLKTQVGEKDKVIGDLTAAESRRRVVGALTKAARELKVTDTALEDIEMYAGTFEVNEDGAVVTKDGLSAKLWLEDMQSKRPHWWGPTSGGGAGGNRGKGEGGAANNPFSAEHWNMTEQGKIYNADPKRAEKLAAQAGTTIGGKKPEPKK